MAHPNMQAFRWKTAKRRQNKTVLLASSTSEKLEEEELLPEVKQKFFSLDRFLTRKKRLAPPVENPSSRKFLRSSLDVYGRVALDPLFRLRVKHTLALFEKLKVKSKITAGIGQGPKISLEVKVLECMKYRVTNSGNGFQVRARSALQMPHTEIDISYERKQGNTDYVRVVFRFGDAVFVKIPGLCAGIKMKSRIGRFLKTTLRLKKDFVYLGDSSSAEELRNRSRTRNRLAPDSPRKEPEPVHGLERTRREINRILNLSEMGLETKFRWTLVK